MWKCKMDRVVGVRGRVHACMHACMRAHVHACHTRMRACVHACMLACTRLYIHAYIHTYTHKACLQRSPSSRLLRFVRQRWPCEFAGCQSHRPVGDPCHDTASYGFGERHTFIYTCSHEIASHEIAKVPPRRPPRGCMRKCPDCRPMSST